MKIAFFLNEFPALSETFILYQIVGLIRRGHDCDIHARWRVDSSCQGQHGDVERYHLLDHARFYPLPGLKVARLKTAVVRLARWGWRRPHVTLDCLNMFRYGWSALSLRPLYERLPAVEGLRQYDVIHCHYGPNGRRALDWRDFGALRGPIITTFHGYDVNRLPRIEGNKLYQSLFDKGEQFTVGSEFMRKRLIALGAPQDRIVKFPMGVDLSRFPFTERIKSNDGDLKLLTVARLVEVKGIEYAIRAVASLKGKFPRIRYQIVGDGPLRTDLERLAGQLDLAENVEFLGALSQEDIIKLLQEAQLFVLSSVATASGEEEGQSVVLAEAQASGLPVIGSAIGGISESVREGASGLLVPPRDPGALARAIEQLVERRQDWNRMGRAGRAHVEKNFDLEKLNDRLIDLYRTVAGHGLE